MKSLATKGFQTGLLNRSLGAVFATEATRPVRPTGRTHSQDFVFSGNRADVWTANLQVSHCGLAYKYQSSNCN